MALTQEDLQAIGQVIDQKLDTRLKPMEQRFGGLETTVGQMKIALDAVLVGQEAQATKADIHDLKVELGRKVIDHERRLENLEEETGTPNPHKH
jgi:hypothetical protein